MEDRDLQILKHVAHFRVSIPAVIRTLFFPNNPSAYAPVMDRLRKNGYLKSRRALKKNGTFHQLTRTSTRILGLPESLAVPMGRQALLRQLSILWFCTMRQPPFTYIADSVTLGPLFSGGSTVGNAPFAPAGAHCIANVGGMTLFHIYVVMPDTGRDNLFKSIWSQYDAAKREPMLAPLVDAKQYGFAILVQSEVKREVIDAFLHGRIRGNSQRVAGAPLSSRARFLVECVPNFEKTVPDSQSPTVKEPANGTLG